MSILDVIFWVLRQIRQRLLESILIILGIALGVGAICNVLGLIEGFNKQASDIINSINGRTFQIVPSQIEFKSDESTPLKRFYSEKEVVNLTFDDYLEFKKANLEGIKYVWISRMVREISGGMQDRSDLKAFKTQSGDRGEYDIEFCLATPEIFAVADLNLLKGDIFRDFDVINKNKVVVLGDELAKLYFGEQNPVGQELWLRFGKFKVIGVVHKDVDVKKRDYITGIGASDKLNKIAYIPYFSYKFDADENLLVECIYIMADEGVDLNKFYNNLKNIVRYRYPNGIGIHGRYLYQNKIKNSFINIGKLIVIFSCAVLLIASINILNLMMARVLRRYKHIGISAALGASRKDIFILFLVEAIILGVFGNLLGMAIAFGGLKLLSQLVNYPLSLTLFTWVVGSGITLLISLIFGLYPAIQASQVCPVDALRVD
ncbi:hypothetical protein BBF96_09245 [Anoxybacter fermentans]|uniref:ABC transporter permease n=1 Tax=Anoxybacter fermentans TaxID=1323375 RepID=A0A3Q9HQM1_9FIRM|nr:ABC transporter permease [Anoxybacter fermentans]AZR73556.1 hypothetical protein BBF96_09245 [Anoxybacter fermentans]